MAPSFGVIACVVVLVTLLGGASAQTTHVVLEASGWIIPQTPNAYATWAASQTFRVGDILMFNFTTGQHDVAEVSRESYNACSTTGVIGSIVNNGPASLTLTTAGEHYYICAFPGHCGAGQKLMINVTGSPSTASPPMPSTPSPMPSTPMMPTPPMPSTPPPSSMPLAPMPTPPMPSTPSPMPSTPMPAPPMPSTPSPSLSPLPPSPMSTPPMPSTPPPSLSPMPPSPMSTPPMPSPPSPMATPPAPSTPSPLSPPSPMMPPPPTSAPVTPGGSDSASVVVSASLAVIFMSIILNMMV